ncbi:hypothetical protein [Roseibium sp.]|uniref:hypothetical protein n=1 Tax=Roseibium sp. TaxID=1936156 RepID=UPI003A9731BF
MEDLKAFRDWALARSTAIENGVVNSTLEPLTGLGGAFAGVLGGLGLAGKLLAGFTGRAVGLVSGAVYFADKFADGAADEYAELARAAQKHIDIIELKKCFSAATLVRVPEGVCSPISEIRPGDLVLSFDPLADNGRGALVPKKVVRTFTNITEEWLRLTWVEEGVKQELVTTPGHEFLTAHGGFRQIEQLMAGGTGTLVLADGTEAEVSAERIVYSAETAEMFEQAEGFVLPQNGNLALKPEFKKGWKTYNFEVEDFHTYVAGGTVKQSGLPEGRTFH